MIVTVPNVIGFSVADATAAITAVGLVVGTETPALNPNVSIGNVGFQNPAAYAQVPASTTQQQFILDSDGNQVYDSNGNPLYTNVTVPTAIDLGISAIAISPNIDLTLISQYAQSPVLTQLIDNLAQYFDMSANWNNFYQYVWNLDTAVGFGLDFWGKVLGVTRYLEIPVTAEYLGLESSGGTASGYPFGVGVFFDGSTDTQTYALDDDTYRTLLYAKAFANICRCVIPVLNQLLRLLFSSYGDAYCLDNGNMMMTFYLGWNPTAVQLAIIEQSGVIPHPTGVGVSIQTGGGAPATGDNLTTETSGAGLLFTESGLDLRTE
jgi:hypothetical protein